VECQPILEDPNMSRLVAITLAALALACGPQERTQTGAPETPPVEAPAATGAAAPAIPETPEPPAAEAAADPQAQSCLDLVASMQFVEAIPVCTAALQANPGNEAVKSALAQAQAEAAKTAAAGAAAEAAAGAAAGDAAGAAAGAATGEMPKLPQ
jgi:hypothetical protein